MSLISTNNLAKSFGAEDIFEGINIAIPHRARIAIVGSNGVGKTTLLRIIAGLENASEGQVQRARNLRMGYLPQEVALIAEGTLWEQCLNVFNDIINLEEEMRQLELDLADPQKAEEALARYSSRQHRFEHAGGYTYELEIKQTLTGLGFSAEDYHRPMMQLSGGQRTRAYLARLLLENPDLLLLDEPTNHLDIAAVEWLEAYLKDWGGAVLIVSHDRYFLDQAAQNVWEMTPAIEEYRGNYSAYLQQREARYARRLAEYEAQSEFIEKEEDYIRRNIAGQNTRQARGRQRRLERLLADSRLVPPPKQPRRMGLRFESKQRSGDLVLRTQKLQVGYHDEGKPLFNCPDLTFRRGECAAIIGPNGAGKTTFLKTILRKIPPFSGEVDLGASLKVGYFAQAHEELNPDLTLMEEIERLAPKMLPGEIRDYLAKFLFTGDDVFKPVEVLSGGERGRLALAKLGLSGANLLLLDEPTNHLDLPTQEVLESILSAFTGTILLVSHDRYLIDALASQIWEVDPKAETLNVFEGSYTAYRAMRNAQAAQAQDAASSTAAKKQTPSLPKTSAEKKLSNFQLGKLKARLQAVEHEIAGLEARQKVISRLLENPKADSGEVHQLGNEYVANQAALDALLEEWQGLEEQLG